MDIGLWRFDRVGDSVPLEAGPGVRGAFWALYCWADQGDVGRGKSKEARITSFLAGSAGLRVACVGLVVGTSLSLGF